MKLLLFGKTGQLGWELQRTLAPLGELYALGPDELDLTNLTSLRNLIHSLQPQIIINASAYTAVDKAEEQSDLSMALNAEAPAVMAQAADELKASFIHYSTDYVFDGTKNSAYTEDDETNPLNMYGQSKLIGEQAISQVGGAYVTLRTSWVYSLRGNGFVSKVLFWARNQETLRIVTDQVGSPTWARMLAETTTVMIAQSSPDTYKYFSERSGIYHLGGAGGVSRFDFTRAILDLDSRSEEHRIKRLDPALTLDFPTLAKRPLFTVLNCSRFERVFGLNLPSWMMALQLAMAEAKFG